MTYCPPPPDYNIQFVYVGMTWASDRDTITKAINRAARLFTKSGGQELVLDRWPGCKPRVMAYTLPSPWQFEWYATGLPGLDNRPNVRRVVFDPSPSDGACGRGWMWVDDRHGRDNLNNGNLYSSARIFRCGWNGQTVLHEIMHILGAVQQGTDNPNDGRFGHCLMQGDPMCVTSGRDVPLCPGFWRRDHRLLDCTGDTYYNPRPPPGGHLESHWNVADSRYVRSP